MVRKTVLVPAGLALLAGGAVGTWLWRLANTELEVAMPPAPKAPELQAPPQPPPSFPAVPVTWTQERGRLILTAVLPEHALEIENGAPQSKATLRKGGGELASDTAPLFRLATWNGAQCEWLETGARGSAKVVLERDLDGDRLPEIVLGRYSGQESDSCPERAAEFLYVSLASGQKRSAGRSLFGCPFGDVNEDGMPEFFTYDVMEWEEYSRCRPFRRPYVRIALAYREGEFRFDPAVVRRPSPDGASFASYVKAIEKAWGTDKKDDEDLPPQELWCGMLEMIYSGNADSAWQLLEVAWPPTQSGKQEWLERFRKDLPRLKYANLVPKPD